MIKKLRYKFILIAMISVSIVLIAILGVINVQSLNSLVKEADMKIELIKEGNGKFNSNIPFSPNGSGDNQMSPETPFETRFFTVTLDLNGNYQTSDTTNIVSVDEEDVKTYSSIVYKNNKSKGFVEDFRFNAYQDGQYIRIIFIDCGRSQESRRETIKNSIVVGTISLGVTFLLILFFSRAVFEPIALSYKKQKQFITNANHDLKTPLAVISADCECLEMECEENEWTKSIKDQVAKLTDLTNKLVFLSRMDEENTNAVMTEFSLSEIVLEKANEYNSLAKANNKDYIINVEDNISYTGDMSMIKQMISLLLDNAFKYSNDGGNVSISLSQNGKQKKLEIYNTCNEINKDDIKNLFERFYRVDSSRNSKTGGHGIGLSVVKAICDLHKAKIEATTSDSHSLTFTINF